MRRKQGRQTAGTFLKHLRLGQGGAMLELVLGSRCYSCCRQMREILLHVLRALAFSQRANAAEAVQSLPTLHTPPARSEPTAGGSCNTILSQHSVRLRRASGRRDGGTDAAPALAAACKGRRPSEPLPRSGLHGPTLLTPARAFRTRRHRPSRHVAAADTDGWAKRPAEPGDVRA